MNKRRLRLIVRHHGADRPHRPCPVDTPSEPCDAVLLAAEVTRLRVWADFASDLLDAHIWGFGPGDWQASDALAHALWGSDEAPRWRRDRLDPTHIIVDPRHWPKSVDSDGPPDQ